MPTDTTPAEAKVVDDVWHGTRWVPAQWSHRMDYPSACQVRFYTRLPSRFGQLGLGHETDYPFQHFPRRHPCLT